MARSGNKLNTLRPSVMGPKNYYVDNQGRRVEFVDRHYSKEQWAAEQSVVDAINERQAAARAVLELS